MTYGDPAWRPWVLDEERARPFIREALEAGIDFFDSADIYSTGDVRGSSDARSGPAARGPGNRHQGVLSHERQAQRLRLVAQASACQRGCLAAAVAWTTWISS
ncbi:hypothetical protein ACP3P8_24890 [Pseudomonas aeruginosa]